ncbi:MAG: HesA/MoeB/ThiF family protein [Clostridium sp.]
MEDKRYKRHLLLPGVGEEGQKKLKKSRVLVVGAGGLGSSLSMYLAAAGVGTIGIADFDCVDESNLQRQILYREEDIGMLKAQAAKKNLEAMNSGILIRSIEEGLTKENARRLISDYDVIADATDNFYARYLLNDTCVEANKPDVYGAICEFEGQVAVFSAGGPCLRCLNPEPPKLWGEPDFKNYGVLGALPGLVGCIQAAEVLKIILGIGETLSGRMLFIDALTMKTEEMELPKNPRCPICGKMA